MYSIYNDDSVKLLISGINVSGVVKEPVCSIEKKKLENVVDLFNDVKIDCSDGFVINSIKYNDSVINPRSGVLDLDKKYNFDVKKSYIATTDKKIVNLIINFYEIVKDVTENKTNDIFDIKNDEMPEEKVEEMEVDTSSDNVVFDASKETKLQDALNMQFVNPNKDGEETANSNVEEQKEVENSDVSKSKKNGGYKIFVFCIIASLILTVLAILIATRVIQV